MNPVSKKLGRTSALWATLMVAFVVLVAGIGQTVAQTGAKKPMKASSKVKTRSAKGPATVDADKNIKDKTRQGDPNAKPMKPAKKGGKKRAAEGVLMVDNYSGYAVDIYIDDYYKGTVAAYGELYFSADSGYYHLYGRSTGGSATFGPSDVYVPKGDVGKWSLYD